MLKLFDSKLVCRRKNSKVIHGRPNCMDIEFLLTQPENTTLEFKQDLSSLKPIIKTVIAFANTDGGVLVIVYSTERGILGLSDI